MSVTAVGKDWPRASERAASEWRFVGAVMALVLIVTSLPYAYAYLTAPPDKQFMGIMFDVPDHTQYFSWMRELSEAPLSANKLTPEPNSPVFFNLLWWGMGHLGKLFGLGYAGTLQVLRVISSVLFLLLAYRVCSWFFDGRLERRTAFLAVLFASGFGWMLVVLKYLLGKLLFPLLIYIIEPNTFLGILSTPHLIAAALYIFVFDLILRGEVKGQLRYAVAAGLFALFLGWQHAYDLLLIYGILGSYGILKLLRDRRLPLYLIQSGFILGITSWWPALYSILITSNDPVWKAVLAQYANAGVYTPNPLLLIILMGPAFLLALFDVVKSNPLRLSGLDDKSLFLRAWFWGNFLLIYIPTDYQIKMLNGWQVPIAILATQGLFQHVSPVFEKLVRRIGWTWSTPALRRRLAAILVLIILPTNLYLWLWRFIDLARHDYPFYLHKDEMAALTWLENEAKSDDVVLSSLMIGQYIPALTGTHAFLAHWAQTVDFYGKSRMAEEFFSDDTDDPRRQEILQLYSVDYIFYGPFERTLGNYQPETALLLRRVYVSPLVEIYQVQK